MIEVSSLRQRDLAAVAALFEQTTMAIPYCWALSPQAFRECVLFDEGAPYAELAVDSRGWLVARAGERTLGFAHCAIGRLNTDARIERRGFLRFLTTLPDAPPAVASALLTAANSYFRGHGVERIDAFHVRTGYSCYLAGRGVLANDRLDLMAALGDAGYRMCERWFLYEKVFQSYVIERVPDAPGFSLQIDDRGTEGFAMFIARGVQPVAELLIDFLPALSENTGIPTASLRELNVEEAFRRKGIGRWLLLRTINELAARGYHRLVVDINLSNAPAQSLLLSLGFEELPLRGYSYEKQLQIEG